MSYLLDTNIVSEIRKNARCDPNVAAWYASVDGFDLHLSVLVTGEIRKGIEQTRKTDPAQARHLEQWLTGLFAVFQGRILAVTDRITDEWGRMSAIRSLPVIDGLLAATAKAHGLTFVTRNTKDVKGLGMQTLDPFKRKP